MNTTSARGTKVLILKEIRENARWAVIGGILLTIVLLYTAFQRQDANSRNVIQFWTGISTTMTVGAPLVALALAFLQIIPERSRDKWAFFVHRPATASVLFAGKTVGGLVLYLLITLIPLAALTLWAKVPGNLLGPFDWRFLESEAVSTVIGIAYYFAGLLIAMRSARWYGSRLLPIPAAILGSLCVSVVPEFWQALAIAALAIVVIGWAAWGSFQKTGELTEQQNPARAFLGLTMFFGTVVTVPTIVAMLVAMASILFPHAPTASPWTTYAIAKSGEIVRTTQLNGIYTQVTDKLGHPIPGLVPSTLQPSDLILMTDLVPAGYYARSQQLYNDPRHYVRELAPYQYANSMGEQFNWYIYNNYVLGYSQDRRQLAGIMTSSGYRSITSWDQVTTRDKFAAIQMGKTDGAEQILPTDSGIYLLDFGKLQLYPLILGPEARAVKYIYRIETTDDPKNYKLLLVASTEFHIVDIHGNQRGVIHREYSSKDYPVIQWSRLSHGRLAFLYTPGGENPKLREYNFVITDVVGKVLDKESVPPLPKMASSRPGAGMYILLGAGLTLPLGLIMVLFNAIAQPQHTLHEIMREVFNGYLLCFIAGGLMMGLISAALTWCITRRCVLSRYGATAWVAGSFILSWTGIILLLCLHGWPVREICPTCGRKRSIERDTCEHCGAGWLRVPKDGTEIFEARIAEAVHALGG